MRKELLFVFLAVAGSMAAPVQAERFQITAGEPNEVRFVSKAPMETFSGSTRAVSGWVDVDPSAVGDSVSVHIEVDLATIDTGISKRNRHMRENHMETDRYPKAVFDGATILSAQGTLTVGQEVAMDAEGTFSLHGVSQRIWVSVRVVLSEGNVRRLSLETSFPVALADYNIERPKFLFLKLNDVQDVSVTLSAESGSR